MDERPCVFPPLSLAQVVLGSAGSLTTSLAFKNVSRGLHLDGAGQTKWWKRASTRQSASCAQGRMRLLHAAKLVSIRIDTHLNSVSFT